MQLDAETVRVGRFHDRVQGECVAGDGSRGASAAEATDLVRWVHLAFTDAFLPIHQAFGGAILGGPDAYVADWATAGSLIRVPDPPLTEAALRAEIDGSLNRGELRCDERVGDIVRLLKKTPVRRDDGRRLSPAVHCGGRDLPAVDQTMLGLRLCRLPVKKTTRLTLLDRASATCCRNHPTV